MQSKHPIFLQEPYNLGLLFEKECASHSYRIALRFENGMVIDYLSLNSRANQIANLLKKKGVARQDVVVILNNKELNEFAGMLACLKIGAIYANLDSSNPADRLLKMINTCLPKTILFDSAHSSLNFNKNDFKTVCVDFSSKEFKLEIQEADSNNLPETRNIHGNMAAYIMFTSGSTGFPKGVVITHANVMHFINWSKSRFEVTPNDVVANVNPIYFDNSVFDFYTALFNGASLAPIPHSILKKPIELLKIINNLGCTLWFSVPSLLIYLLNLKIIKSNDFKNIRKIIFGGEGFPKPKLKLLYDLFSDRITFTNVYGPTECTCICSSYDLRTDDLNDLNGILPLGEINSNFDFLILDEFGKQVSQGAVGELCLLGPCVGKGYYGNFELTNNSFKKNPYSIHLPETMYCTGDLVYQNTITHTLHFVARKDNQIKYQGYRIELDEIEAAFYRLSYVDEAVVIYSQNDIATAKITAFIATNDNKTETEVVSDIRKLLPEYMVPKRIVFKPILPKNKNGKIDRVLIANECSEL